MTSPAPDSAAEVPEDVRRRFVDQTILYEPDGPEQGNCTEAAVASILGISLSDVPDFRADGTEAYKFWSAFRRFIRSRGYEPVMLPGNHCHDVLYLASGSSPRGVNHMVVMRSGELVHDPHPSKAGIVTVDHIWLLVPQDAAAQQERVREDERKACIELASQYCWARYKGRKPANLREPAVFTSHEWQNIADAIRAEREKADRARLREAKP